MSKLFSSEDSLHRKRSSTVSLHQCVNVIHAVTQGLKLPATFCIGAVVIMSIKHDWSENTNQEKELGQRMQMLSQRCRYHCRWKRKEKWGDWSAWEEPSSDKETGDGGCESVRRSQQGRGSSYILMDCVVAVACGVKAEHSLQSLGALKKKKYIYIYIYNVWSQKHYSFREARMCCDSSARRDSQRETLHILISHSASQLLTCRTDRIWFVQCKVQ